MYGYYNLPVMVQQDGLSISFEKDNNIFFYTRELNGEKVEKIVSANKCKLLLNPVEPFSTPKEIGSNLLIEFEKKIMVEPKNTLKVFVKFPMEIGVFITGDVDYELIDVFSFNKSKFSLYGEITRGILCKYYKSGVFSSIPETICYQEGVIELRISNITNDWVELTKAVLNAYGMKIYYNGEIVSLKANMRILSESMAETEFVDSPIREQMEKSLELYTSRRLKVITSKFNMFGGI